MQDLTGSGTISSLDGIVSTDVFEYSLVAFDIQGTWIATLVLEATIDGSHWFYIQGLDPSAMTIVGSFSTPLQVLVPCTGLQGVRIRASLYTSGTVNISFNESTNSSVLATKVQIQDSQGKGITSQLNGIQEALDVGINVAGVQIDPRQIRSLISSDVVTANQGGIWNITDISGTVSLPTGAATESTLSSLNSKVTVVNTGAVTISSSLPSGTNVIGHIISDSGSTTAITGNVTVVQGTGTNLHTVLDSGTLTSITNALPTGTNTIGAVTQASGPWTSNITQIAGSSIATAATGIPKIGLTDGSGTSITLGQKAMSASVPVVIASDQISTTPQVEYISRFVKNNQVYGFSGTISAATAGTDNPLCFIRNPSGSGKILYLYLVRAGTLVANVGASFHVTANPITTANGTSQTPVSLNVGGGAPISSMLVTTLPTVTAIGSILETIDLGQNSDAVIFGNGFSIAINPNNSLLFTANPSSNGRNIDFTIQWVEL